MAYSIRQKSAGVYADVKDKTVKLVKIQDFFFQDSSVFSFTQEMEKCDGKKIEMMLLHQQVILKHHYEIKEKKKKHRCTTHVKKKDKKKEKRKEKYFLLL